MSADIIRRLMAIGLTTEQIADVMDIMEDATEARRAKGRERWKRWNDKRLTNVSKQQQTLAPNSREHARVEDNLQTKNSTGQKENKKNTPRDELAAVLDADRADAVLEHRQKLRKPLTPRAAHLLAKKLAAAPDANAAADLMVEKGWLSFELAWAEKPTPRASGPPRNAKRNFADVALDRMNGNGSEGVFGDHGDAQRVSAGQREPGPDDGHLRGGIAGRYLPGRH